MKKPHLQNSSLTGKGFYLHVSRQHNLLRIFVRSAIKAKLTLLTLEVFKYLDSDMRFITSFKIRDKYS